MATIMQVDKNSSYFSSAAVEPLHRFQTLGISEGYSVNALGSAKLAVSGFIATSMTFVGKGLVGLAIRRLSGKASR